MKKILALLLALSMLFALTACGKDNENPESTGTSTSTTESTTDTTDKSQGGTEGTTNGDTSNTTEPPSTTPPTTEPPATEPPATNPPTTPPETNPPHTHSYTSKVTTSASCDKDGIKTFTCSCGDSYTEKINAIGHSWGDWKVKTQALVDKVGTEQRTCSLCSATDTQDSTKNAAFNSFYDWALVVVVMNDYGSVNGSTLLSYARCALYEYIDKAVAADTIFAALSERFAYGITDDTKKQMKDIASWQGSYDAQNDTFTLYIDAVDPGEFKLLGYVHNGGNKYTTYYSFTPHEFDTTLKFAVELEYNRTNGKPNRYLSIGRTDALPSDMIKSE